MNYLLLQLEKARPEVSYRQSLGTVMSGGIVIPRCCKCPRDALVHQAYSGRSLCGIHLEDSMRKKFNRALREQLHIPKVEQFTILVAISGGKDSAVLLKSLVESIGKIPHVRLVGGCVDEGIAGYRLPSLECARQLCIDLGIEFVTVSYPELGFEEMDKVVVTMAEIGEKKSPCSYCGVFRRQGINHLAKRIGAEVIALGHNLDDMAQTILMNVQNGEVERTLRLAPHTGSPKDGMIPRIVPLRWIPEQEIYLLALFNNLPIHHEECPHGGIALRFRHRENIARMEADIPGTRHGLLRFADGVKALYRGETAFTISDPMPCERCGEMSSMSICKSCEMKDTLGLTSD